MCIFPLLVVLLVRGPKRQIVAQQLHDQRRVLVRILRQRVQLRDGVVECALGDLARLVRLLEDFIVDCEKSKIKGSGRE